MVDHDLLILGGGTGNIVAAAAADEGLDVGLIERDRLGGTCLTRGCNPSKQLVQRANVAETVRTAGQFGVDATLDGVDVGEILKGVAAEMAEQAAAKEERARERDGVTLYQCEGHFVDDRVVAVETDDGGERLAADRVVLAGGSRPLIPDSIDGTDRVDYLTSAEVLQGHLTERPDRLVIVGGGYVAVELSHVFTQFGTDVCIVGHGETLVDREDADIAEQVTEAYRKRHDLHLGYEVTELATDGGAAVVTAASEDGEEIRVRGEELLMATGRRPNSDHWNVTAAGIETDDVGFVETDEHLRTSVDDVWAIGDIAGNYMFKHAGDTEAAYVVENAVRGNETPVEYPGMAHAIFGSPEVGSLGATEGDLDEDVDYETGTFAYEDQALGSALRHEGGFAKVIVGADGEILGVHVVGPEASTLIHEVSTAVAAGADAETVAETIHVHPALSEVVQGAFRDVCDVAPSGL